MRIFSLGKVSSHVKGTGQLSAGIDRAAEEFLPAGVSLRKGASVQGKSKATATPCFCWGITSN